LHGYSRFTGISEWVHRSCCTNARFSQRDTTTCHEHTNAKSGAANSYTRTYANIQATDANHDPVANCSPNADC